jgi:hypothetical protein
VAGEAKEEEVREGIDFTAEEGGQDMRGGQVSGEREEGEEEVPMRLRKASPSAEEMCWLERRRKM